MTVVYSSKLTSGRVYIASDAAVGYSDGYRQLMEEGKWWTYDSLFVGESGADFALSRIRAEFEAMEAPPSPELLAESIRKVAKKLAGKHHVDDVEAQLLYASPTELAVVGGDGGILRRRDSACVGHGATILMAWLDARLPPVSKRSLKLVDALVQEGLAYTARHCESVCDPFFTDWTR